MDYLYTNTPEQFSIGFEECKKQPTVISDSDVSIEEISDQAADKYDYILATSSGLLTAGLDIFWRGSFSLDKAHENGTYDVNKLVFNVAKYQGYKGSTQKGAIKYLESNFKIPADSLTAIFGGSRQHHLRDLTHHFSIIGLISSIFSQFTLEGYGSNTEGTLIYVKFPTNEYIGSTIAEKITTGTITWVLHIISDMAGSSGAIGEGTGVPGPLLSLLKTLSLNKNINAFVKKYNKGNSLSFLVSKMFNGTYFKKENELIGIRFDFRTELGIGKELSKQMLPIIINECIIRSFYFIRHLIDVLDSKRGKLQVIDYKQILPFQNRVISRMDLVSSATFNGIMIANAAIRAKIKNPNNKSDFAKDFLLSINYAGIVRLVIAVKTDAKYLGRDFQNACNSFKEYINTKQKQLQTIRLKLFQLSNNQNRILVSLKRKCFDYDIETSKKDQSIKQLWLASWIKKVEKTYSVDDNFFITSDKELSKAINNEIRHTADNHWLNIISLELVQLIAYYPLETANDKLFKKLKFKNEYVFKQYSLLNKNINNQLLNEIKGGYKRNENYLKGTTQKTVGTIVATATVTLATAGIAWAFAPSIAVWLAGGTFTGLYGVALTNASLAMLGGGSLAVGGFGMAGGAAVITGGGAFLGAVSAYGSLMLVSPKQYALRELSKILTYTDVFLKEDLNSLVNIQIEIEDNINFYEASYRNFVTKSKNSKEEKDIISSTKATIKYLKLCGKKISKLINNKLNPNSKTSLASK